MESPFLEILARLVQIPVALNISFRARLAELATLVSEKLVSPFISLQSADFTLLSHFTLQLKLRKMSSRAIT